MSALGWIIHLVALAACVTAPLPAAMALAARTRGGAAHLLLALLCLWLLLEALMVVTVGIGGPLTLGRVLMAEALLAVFGKLLLLRQRALVEAMAAELRAGLARIGGWSVGERMMLAAIVSAGLGAAAAMLATPSGDYDTWMYQLPQMAEWLQQSSLDARQEQWLDKTGYERGILYYPGTWTALGWLATAPLGRDTCTLLPNLVVWTILGLATRALALRAGADRAAALGAAAAAMLMPLAALNLHSAHVDLALGAVLVATLHFAAHGVSEGDRASRWLALALAGLLIGIKMSGIGMLAAPLLLAAWLWRGRARPAMSATVRSEPAFAALACASLGLLGGYWYASNWAETGNPLGFVAMRLLGHDFPGAIDKAYIDRTNLLHVFSPLKARHWLLLIGTITVFCAPAAALAIAALRRLPRLLADSRAARALSVTALLLACGYVAGPWSAKHAHDADLSWWMGQQLRYTFAFWSVAAAIAAAALSGSAAMRRAVPILAIAAAAAFPFCTYGWIVAAPITLAAAAWCWRIADRGLPRLGHLGALGVVALLVALVPLADALRWRLLNARTGEVPQALAASLGPAEPIAFWGSHQSWLLYGRDLRRSVRYIELEHCATANEIAAAMRARGCAWIALGPQWRDFDPACYRLVEDHPERFALADGDPQAWGMCVYRLTGR